MAEGTTRRDTALGVAKARFVDGLSRKASELRGAVALVTGSPDADRPREEMRRRLHALYASAQVFRLEPLADSLRDAIRRLDAARDERRALTQDDLDSLAHLAATLPLMGVVTETDLLAPSNAPEPERSPHASPSSSAPVAGRRGGRRTLQGMAPSEPPREPAPEPHQGPIRYPSRVDTVINVLVVDGADSQARVRAALPVERFEMLAATDPEEALRIARSSAPDVLLVDLETIARPDLEFVRRLRSDPLTEFVPVIVLSPSHTQRDFDSARQLGADDVISKPIDTDAVARTIARATGTLLDPSAPLTGVGDATLAELTERVSDEIRRGIVESVEQGGDVKIALGDGVEVLAAAWSAISRIRAHVAQRTGGRVRFRDTPRRGGPALLALVDEDPLGTGGAPEVSLSGRRIVVADDDPGIVWFFAGLLREEGAEVLEAADGAEALRLARKMRPDLVVSDILMPVHDGFALCRDLKRDPALADVPVILLSWKEDFLQRMRELDAGASAYLRKEAGASQILGRVRAVLRPRSRLESQLRAGGEVRGRIERIGIVPLLRTTARERRNARVTLRDAWNLFELDIRRGELVDATRTATDGSFARGEAALPQLLGITAGRFTITGSEAAVRPTLQGAIEETLDLGAERLGAMLDAVSGAGLMLVSEVEFDPDVLSSVLRTSPEPIRELVQRLSAGEGPREILIGGGVAPNALEAVLVDLARRGAITAVRGPAGDDRVAEALRLREELSDVRTLRSALPSTTTKLSAGPVATAPSVVVGDPARTLKGARPPPLPEAEPIALTRAKDASSPGSSSSPSLLDLTPTPAPSRSGLATPAGGVSPPPLPTSGGGPAAAAAALAALAAPASTPAGPSSKVQTFPVPTERAAPASSSTLPLSSARSPQHEKGAGTPAASATQTGTPTFEPAKSSTPAPTQPSPSAQPSSPAPTSAHPPTPASTPTPALARAQTSTPAPTETPAPPRTQPSAAPAPTSTSSSTSTPAQPSSPAPTSKPAPTQASTPEPTPAPTQTPAQTPTPKPTPTPAQTPTPTPTPTPAQTPTPTPTPTPALTPAPKPALTPEQPHTPRLPSPFLLAFFIAALFVLGFVGVTMYRAQRDASARARTGDGDRAHTAGTGPGAGAGATSAVRAASDAGTSDDEVFGRVLPYILDAGVRVGPTQGLLVIEDHSAASPSRIRIGDGELGTAPRAVALPEGSHTLLFVRPGLDDRYRVFHIRHGQTRVVEAP